MDEKQTQKLITLSKNSSLAIFDELQEMNELLKAILEKEIDFPEKEEFPEIPETDLSGVVEKLDQLLTAISKEREPTRVEVKLELE